MLPLFEGPTDKLGEAPHKFWQGESVLSHREYALITWIVVFSSHIKAELRKINAS